MTKQIHGTIVAVDLKQSGTGKGGAWNKYQVVIKNKDGQQGFYTFDENYLKVIGELRYWTLVPNRWTDYNGFEHEDWNMAKLEMGETR